MSKYKELRKAAREVLKRVSGHGERAPNHCHNVPGYWDNDGRPCKQCAAFKALKELTE